MRDSKAGKTSCIYRTLSEHTTYTPMSRYTPIGDHVQYRSKFRGLVQRTGHLSIHCVQKTRYHIRECAVLWMVAHKMERQPRQNDACISYEQGQSLLGSSQTCAPIRFGTNRNTFSEYVCAVARSTATLASTTSIEGLCRRRWGVESAM